MKPEKTLEYVEFLLRHDLLEQALRQYVLILNDEVYVAQKSGKSKFQLTLELAEFISKYPHRAHNLGSDTTAEDVLRKALEKYPSE
jgi:pre-mRNA-splicing factor SYF1